MESGDDVGGGTFRDGNVLMAGWFNVAPEEELTPGTAKLVDVDNVMVAVFNLDGEYYAIEDVCTHDGAPMLGCGLEQERVVDGSELICPRQLLPSTLFKYS